MLHNSSDDSSSRAFKVQDVRDVTAVEWINYENAASHDSERPTSSTFLALGTSDGVLLVYSLQGTLLVRQVKGN